MREILFKAKRIDNGEWVEGWLFKTQEHTYIADDRQFDDDLFLSPLNIFIAVDENTICQYTGLTDKNGKRIWENDIVNCIEKRGAAFFHCVVAWNWVKARFDVNTFDCNFPMTLDPIPNDIAINGLDYEVIGNIFDNPELLGESE